VPVIRVELEAAHDLGPHDRIDPGRVRTGPVRVAEDVLHGGPVVGGVAVPVAVLLHGLHLQGAGPRVLRLERQVEAFVAVLEPDHHR
jgi:hypothetical protein